MTPGIYNEIVERLLADDSLAAPAVSLVDAACRGDAALAAEIDAFGEDEPSVTHLRSERPPPAAAPPAYLRQIEVAGFRGIGPATKLTVVPGPGLTLVLGRNGSGKSSFSEGLEILLTGTSTRWASRSKEWQHGWRNLHTASGAYVCATFDVEGSEPWVLRRSWKPDAEVDAAELRLRRGSEKLPDFAALGWKEPLSTFRPFLSYAELGSILDQPSRLYDPLKRILGLDGVSQAIKRLTAARKTCDARRKAVDKALDDLRPCLLALDTDDPRARSCLTALSGRNRNLDAVGDRAEIGLGEPEQLGQLGGIAVVLGGQDDGLDGIPSPRSAILEGGANVGLEFARTAHLRAVSLPFPMIGRFENVLHQWGRPAGGKRVRGASPSDSPCTASMGPDTGPEKNPERLLRPLGHNEQVFSHTPEVITEPSSLTLRGMRQVLRTLIAHKTNTCHGVRRLWVMDQ